MKGLLFATFFVFTLLIIQFQCFSQILNSPYDGKEASKMPRIGLGYGIFTYFGDVRDNTFSHPFTSSSGGELTIERNINSYLNLYVKAVAGQISINERSESRNANFRSNLFIGSINILYNFNNFYKKPKVLQPYLGLGVGFFNFDSKTDIKNASGQPYFYWSDGSIRDMSEIAPGAESAKQITRDYTYETDLRILNTEGKGKYSTLAFSVPIEFGALFRVSPRVSFKLGATYYYNFTNLIDNVTDLGEGVMQGKKGPDNFLFTSFNVSFNLFNEGKKSKEIYFDNIPDSLFAGMDTKDSDGDGVPDFQDECAATPKGTFISKTGCPLDDDNDGIENFRDEEANSKLPNPPVTIDGRNFTDEIILAQQSKDSIALPHNLIEKVFANQVRIYGFPVKNFKQSLIDSITRGLAANPEMDTKIDSLFKAIDKDYNSRQKAEKEQLTINNESKGVEIPIVSTSQKEAEKEKIEKEKNEQLAVVNQNNANQVPTDNKTEVVKSTQKDELPVEPDLLSDEDRKAIESIVKRKDKEEVNSTSETELKNPSLANGNTKEIESSSKQESQELPKTKEKDTNDIEIKAKEPEVKKNVSVTAKSQPKGADLYPVEYKNFDFNTDGMLTGDEILKAIDMFTDGLLKITSEELFGMIDFYNSKMKNAKIIDYGVSKGVYIDGVLKIVKKEQVADLTEQKNRLPEKFRKVDANNDGNITSQEVDEIIKKHKAGISLYSKEFTNDLIDWFFGE